MNEHRVKVTLKDGTVIEDDLFQVDTLEQWLILTERPQPILFYSCASVMDQTENDLLKKWMRPPTMTRGVAS